MHSPPPTVKGRGHKNTSSQPALCLHCAVLVLPLAASGDELTQLCQHETGWGWMGVG